MGKKIPFEEFVAKARAKHGDKYQYIEETYKTMDERMTIICHIHGKTTQTPRCHLRGQGCYMCGHRYGSDHKFSDTKEFIRKAKLIHGDKYDYSLVHYKSAREDVDIICPKHGVFHQKPNTHLNGFGCKDCALDAQRHLIAGVGRNPGTEHGGPSRAYQVWINMLKRCYDEKKWVKHPTYKGCSVCDEWIEFPAFKIWYENNSVNGYDLDKDIIVKGNKVYCPERCCFVPPRINGLIVRNGAKRGDYPIGVSFEKESGKFTASINRHGKISRIGRYNSIEDAFSAYKNAKEAYIKEVAQDYFDRGLITERVKDALFRYEVEITD